MMVERKRRSVISSSVIAAIASTASEVKASFGAGSAYAGRGNPFLDVAGWIPTGSTLLDMAISGIPGEGGIPLGRCVEIFGQESNGKSTLAYQLIAECQKMGGVAILIDTEYSFKESWAKTFGVATDGVVFLYPSTIEELFNMIGGAESGIDPEDMEDEVEAEYKSLGKQKKSKWQSVGIIQRMRKELPDVPFLIVWDSIAATTSKEEDEKGYDQVSISTHARVLSKAFRKIVKLFARESVAFVMLNQIRSKINVQWGDKFDTFGGWAPKFYSAVRLELKRITTIKRAGEIIGIRTRVRLVKNKVGAPFKVVEFPIMFDRGIHDVASWFGFLKANNLIKVKKSWARLVVNGEQIGKNFQGELSFAMVLEADKEMYDVAKSLVLGLPLEVEVVEGDEESLDEGSK